MQVSDDDAELAWALVSGDTIEDPSRMAEIRDGVRRMRRERDALEVDEIARASGMPTSTERHGEDD